MNNGDSVHKVWEIRTLKKKVGADEARKFLERIAKQVQPIMRKHNWRVKVLSEMCPKNPRLLGLNVGHGIHVKLRLRRPNTDWDFYPFHEVLDTMLHELCHNSISPHNVAFYKLWDDLRKECEEFMSKGISGSGDGFDLPGRRLGGFTRQPPLSSLRQTALVAAQNRARLGSLLPAGPKRLGGDKSIMSSLTPGQAAAMAAERRLQDDIWCGLQQLVEEDEETVPQSSASSSGLGSKRSLQLDNSHSKLNFVDLTDVPSVYNAEATNSTSVNKRSRQTECCNDLTTEDFTSGSTSNEKTGCDTESSGWECMTCTLLNSPLAPICELCGTLKPKAVEDKYKSWSCKFCTMENTVKMEKCGACEQWRYSYGQPIATPSPNVEQSVVDRTINDICILLQCSRDNLNVVSVAKGLVMGWLRFSEADRITNCLNHPDTAHPIPVHIEEVKDIISVADYILVVEKESVFQRLANDCFCKTNRCIVITGRGYPDIPTRRFLRLLTEQLHLPVYCLVDCDPYGFDILTTYRKWHMMQRLRGFLRYNGLERFHQMWRNIATLSSSYDSRRIKTEAILNRCYLQRIVPQWRLELKLLLESGVKFEIEALSVHSLTFLSKGYLPSKIQGLLSESPLQGRVLYDDEY